MARAFQPAFLVCFHGFAQAGKPLPLNGFCTLQRALPCPRLQPVGIRFSFSAGYSALQRGFSTCFSPAFISSFAEAGREARLKPAGTLRGYAPSPPAKAGGKEEPPEDGWEFAQGLHIIHIPVVRVRKPFNGTGWKARATYFARPSPDTAYMKSRLDISGGSGIIQADMVRIARVAAPQRFPCPRFARSAGERRLRELPGRKDIKTTMIHTHVLNRGPAGVRSPVDGL